MTYRSPLTVRFEMAGAHGTALIAQDDSIWVAVAPSWWAIATWFWWWLCPGNRKATVLLTTAGEHVKVRYRAIRIADKYVRVHGMPKRWH